MCSRNEVEARIDEVTGELTILYHDVQEAKQQAVEAALGKRVGKGVTNQKTREFHAPQDVRIVQHT